MPLTKAPDSTVLQMSIFHLFVWSLGVHRTLPYRLNNRSPLLTTQNSNHPQTPAWVTPILQSELQPSTNTCLGLLLFYNQSLKHLPGLLSPSFLKGSGLTGPSETTSRYLRSYSSNSTGANSMGLNTADNES